MYVMYVCMYVTYVLSNQNYPTVKLWSASPQD